MTETKREQGFLSNMSPKGAFFLGLGGALVLFFVVGFFVLLGIVLKGGGGTFAKRNVVPAAPAAPVAPAAGGVADQGVSAEGMAPITDADWLKGDPNAKVTIVEYSDLECPFCKRHHPILEQLVAEYDGQVNWVYRHFPLTNLHSKAQKEAEATECAWEQGGNDAFWKFTDRIFEITPSNDGLPDSELPKIAGDLGLDVSAFNLCLNSGKYKSKIQADVEDGSGAGVRGTPASFIVYKGKVVASIPGAQPYETVIKQLSEIK